ncbi:transcription elongation factor GreA [Corynebacterium suranareeae]|uniref:Transcription elongation factor GreA n=1 Tax=Corynebacterium suranareeae TaxID=2506452 RepID=A0A160PNF6_9CORY|nr:transcription elongation factor GreA [Corynebacterium suranareeae]BAU95369.1 transcription elongation factor GreA [Corynebacterium suranareeae]
MASADKQYITPETKAKLEEELNALIAHRPAVAAEINERREEGDLKENAGYDAAREMQDQEEARIKQISELLANSTTEREGIIEGVAHVGSVVHVYYDGDENDKETFLIGTRAAASENPDLETYSEQSPLGAAILGAQEGDTREYTAPNGSVISVTVVSAEPYNSAKAAALRSKN